MAFLIPHALGLRFRGVGCLISHGGFLIPHAPGWRFTGVRCLISHVTSACTKAAVNRDELVWSRSSGVGGYLG